MTQLDERPKVALVRFDAIGGTYAVPIARVREVVEARPITPYPETIPRHLGVVNIRGRILPVLEPFETVRSASRLLVLELETGEAFCLLAERVQKVLVPAESTGGAGMINVEGRPVRLLADADLRPAAREGGRS